MLPDRVEILVLFVGGRCWGSTARTDTAFKVVNAAVLICEKLEFDTVLDLTGLQRQVPGSNCHHQLTILRLDSP